MAQSLVSEAAQIREMSPEELEQEYNRIKQEYLEKYRYRIDFDATRLTADKISIIKKQYYQLTGKTLN